MFKKLGLGLALFIASAQPALAAATCTLNGKEVPCDEVAKWLWIAPLVIGIIGLFFFIFWVRMLLDAIKNQKENKLMWVLLIIFLNLIGTIIYYFVEKRPRDKA